MKVFLTNHIKRKRFLDDRSETASIKGQSSTNIFGVSVFFIALLLSIFVHSSCKPPTLKTDYTAHSPGALAPEAVVAPVWKKQLTTHRFSPQSPEELAGAEVSEDGRIVWIGSNDKMLYAFSVKNGKLLWKKSFDASVLAPPLYVPVRRFLFVGGGDGCLHALDGLNGKTKWKYCAKGLIYKRPVYKHGVVYFTNTQNYLYAIDAETGKWRWSYDRTLPEGFGIRDHAGVALYKNRIYTGFKDGYLVCLDSRSGDVLWTRDLREDAKEYVDIDSTPVVHDGVVYATSQGGGVYAITADMGALKWNYGVSSASGVTISQDRIYFVSAKKGVHSLTMDGKLVWRQKLDAGTATRPIVYRDLLIFNTSGKGTYFINKKTGAFVQRLDFGFGASGPLTLFRDFLFLLENGGEFHVMRLY